MTQNKQIFNLSEYAKQVREEVMEMERQYRIKRGETDADPEADRKLTEPVGSSDG